MNFEKQINYFLVAIFLMGMIETGQVFAQTTWYVDNVTGSDQYDGLTLSTQKKTIANVIIEAGNKDTLLISDTGISYGPVTSEPDTITISKYLTLMATGNNVSISSSLELNITDSLYDAASNVEINFPFNLTGNLILGNGIELNETLSLKGNLTITEKETAPVAERKYCFNRPLLFDGSGNQVITVPQDGAYIGSFEINKPNGNVILEGGNLDLSESCDSTSNNILIFTKGLFLTGENILILKAPAGTSELGFVHQPEAGDVSHVVGTVGIDPKFDSVLEKSKTVWPIGSENHYRPMAMYMLNFNDINLDVQLSVSHVQTKTQGNANLPILLNDKYYTYYPDFFWVLSPEIGSAFSCLEYDLEFGAEGWEEYKDINTLICINRYRREPEIDESWRLSTNIFENYILDGTPNIRAKNVRGGLHSDHILFTFGLPTNLYTTGTLPDRTIMWEILQVDIAELFAGSVGELTYSVSSSDTSHVRVTNDNFTTTVFEVEGLVNGVSEICVTATDINGDFLSVYFKVTVDGHECNAISEFKLPDEYQLIQNYPNPFNPTTTIRFGLPARSRVSLSIYNTLGEEVCALVEGIELQAGYYAYNFDAGNLTSGVYFYRIEANDFYEVRKMILIK